MKHIVWLVTRSVLLEYSVSSGSVAFRIISEQDEKVHGSVEQNKECVAASRLFHGSEYQLTLSAGQSSTSNGHNQNDAPPNSPEANVSRAVRLFCESGSMTNGGEEVLHLPVIVEAAEGSPSAAARAAQQIRVFLGRDWAMKPHVQYNAIMLIRILSDNPGPSFTKNFDKQFVSTVKELLRNCKDSSTQQILRESLDSLEANKQFQEGMEGLIQMWRKEKGQQASLSRGQSRVIAPSGGYGPQNEYLYQHPTQSIGNQGERAPSRNALPPPHELASRIEEARNTAKILLQLITSTPADEVLQNELIREFSERCHSAQRSMQTYINCNNPVPDDDTMLTLIETNEQLSLATSRYQRSLLSARRALGITPSPQPEGPPNANGAFAPASEPPGQGQVPALHQPNEHGAFAPGPESYSAPSGPPPGKLNRLNSRENQPSANPPQLTYQPEQPSNPFADPIEHDENPPALAFDPSRYSNSATGASRHQQQPSQSFSIDAGMHDPRNTVDLENAYRTSSIGSGTSPTISPSSTMPARPGTASDGVVSPSSPPRPVSGPYRTSGITQSYLGRQSDAVAGLTMRGAQSDSNVPEIDGHSEVGRKDVRSNTSPTESSDGASNYTATPTGPAGYERRVDIPGTGGLRDSRTGRTGYGQ